MSEILELSVSASEPPVLDRPKITGASFYEKLVLRAFEKFTHGGLRLVWPGGESRVFGNAAGPVTAEIRIRDRRSFFRRGALYGNVGFGEAYVAGDWDTDSIFAVVAWFVENLNRLPGANGSSQSIFGISFLNLLNRFQHRLRSNTVRNSRRNIAAHYDLGNEFYSLWLDQGMTYSSARFTEAGQSLEEAQDAKYEALCQKLRLQTTDHVLEIGCGWGGFAAYAAKKHGCRITAITVSKEQFDFARERMQREGLQDRVEIRMQDYRHVAGQFDKIASIEMIEAVGDDHLETFLGKCGSLVKRNGLLALQMITVPDHTHRRLREGTDWIQKHIFPGSLLLSVNRVSEILSRTGGMLLHHLEDLGGSYARTLHLWWERFNEKLPEVSARGFDDRFVRKWNYYLQYCEAAFAMRHISVVQVCYTRANNELLKGHLAE
jgi:cyclopropane-fatty-acyl-phospholipid synthase